ncbi:uncharacterized protein ACA1_321440 [Acanthamoeba castellanii str. Neff]|uniref:COPI associated protein n=1 Tax=Acanthamoeba castellanii (strain ATCC 30010 / Neff) TaxID=1257118 RepID=L8HKP3_ACACF|nr:uncharacterized protein ACA1_321440 [Acanthamoeba castellanii str. Neff]ELR24961.1 hypothetical protein ACA1_321440 [Acanthamoeba castellanii str. Neff]
MDESQPITYGGADVTPTPKKGCWRSLHDTVARLPVKLTMNFLTIIFALCIVPVVIFNLLTLDLSPLHWIVSIYLLAGVFIVVGSCFPFNWIRVKVLRWFLFLATYNGRGALLFMLGLLCTGISTWGIVAGVGNMVLAAVHVILWVFFHDIVGTEVTHIESKLGRVSVQRGGGYSGRSDTDVEGGGYVPPPTPSFGASTSSPSHEFPGGSGPTNDPTNPYAVAEAYQPPELDPSTSYAVAAVTQQQQRNAYNPF